MNNEPFFNTILRGVEKTALSLLDTITETVTGKAQSLRDGTEFHSVTLPRDLAAHKNVQTEWWYYTGHGVTDTGREFGFELVFFKRRTDLDKFSVVPLRLLGNPFYFAHFAITDKTEKAFRYSHRKSANGPFDYPASASDKHFHLRLGDWSAREANGSHVVRATTGPDITFEASLTPAKPVVLNGKGGISFKDEGEASRYFSYTRMALEGDIAFGPIIEHFTGAAWMDREFGTWAPTDNQKGWDWFSIQLDNNCELMVYQLRDAEGDPSAFSSGTYCDENGAYFPLTKADFAITTAGVWKSPSSGAEYPNGWQISVPHRAISLKVEPVIADQELDTRGTTMIVYWEGACSVTGRADGRPVSGNAYVELVGYDRSHDQPDLSRFLLGNSLDFLRRN